MSSMKAETPVIRSTTHNLLLQWMEYLLLERLLVEQNVTLPHFDQKKKYVFWLILFKNTYVFSFIWIMVHWVHRIDVTKY